MKRIAVFASGNGTNLQAIIDHIARGALRADLAAVVSDRRDAFALKRARKAGVKTFFVDPKRFQTRRAYEEHIVGILKKEKVSFIVLAGFMRIISPFLVKTYKNRILNIHPALLPAFKGVDSIKRAHRYGVKVTGVTVHLVDEKMDHGPIVAQESVPVHSGETVSELEARVHKVEHRIYSKAIAALLTRRFSVRNRCVVFHP